MASLIHVTALLAAEERVPGGDQIASCLRLLRLVPSISSHAHSLQSLSLATVS